MSANKPTTMNFNVQFKPVQQESTVFTGVCLSWGGGVCRGYVGWVGFVGGEQKSTFELAKKPNNFFKIVTANFEYNSNYN